MCEQRMATSIEEYDAAPAFQLVSSRAPIVGNQLLDLLVAEQRGLDEALRRHIVQIHDPTRHRPLGRYNDAAPLEPDGVYEPAQSVLVDVRVAVEIQVINNAICRARFPL